MSYLTTDGAANHILETAVGASKLMVERGSPIAVKYI